MKNVLDVKAPKFKKPEGKKTYIHVFAEEESMIADRFEDGKQTDRYVMDLNTGRYRNYRYDLEKWETHKFIAMCKHQPACYCYYYGQQYDNIVFEKNVRKKLEAKQTGWKTEPVAVIDGIEDEYNSDKRRNAEMRRQDRIRDLQDKVPPLPEDFEEWYFRVSGLDDLNFLLYDENNGKYRCTYCGSKMKPDGIKNLKKCTCKKCGKEVTPRKNRKQLEINVQGAAVIIQGIEEGLAVVRNMDIEAWYTCSGRKIEISEAERMFLYAKWNEKQLEMQYTSRLYYAQNPRGNTDPSFDWKSNPAQRSCKNSFLYPTDIREALKGQKVEYQAYGLQAIADRGICCNIARLMTCVKHKDSANLIEFTAKLGFNRILREAFDHRYWNYDIQYELYPGAKDAINMLPGLSKENRNRLLKLDGGNNTLEWMAWAERHRQRITDETLRFMQDNDISFENLSEALLHMKPEQCMHYITRQQQESYKGKKPKAVVEQWEDYLAMARKLDKKMDDELVYRPKDLKLRHEQLVAESRQQEMLKRAKESVAESKKRAAEISKKFPGAEACLKKIKAKYEYEDDDFIIRVPETLFDISQEGYALHHCVSSSDRYYERMEREETYIVFLRKKENPDVPFYTIEVEPGGTIRQHRGYLDEEPELKVVKPFLQKWQRVVKSRIKEDEKDIIDASARLREENLEDLRITKGVNDRVYKALLEDYMGIEDADELSELPECI